MQKSGRIGLLSSSTRSSTWTVWYSTSNRDGQVTKKTAYLVFGVTLEGLKDVLGIWIGGAESSKFWMKVLVDLKNRGVKGKGNARLNAGGNTVFYVHRRRIHGFNLGAALPLVAVEVCYVDADVVDSCFGGFNKPADVTAFADQDVPDIKGFVLSGDQGDAWGTYDGGFDFDGICRKSRGVAGVFFQVFYDVTSIAFCLVYVF